jgi:hypothetical protein
MPAASPVDKGHAIIQFGKKGVVSIHTLISSSLFFLI